MAGFLLFRLQHTGPMFPSIVLYYPFNQTVILYLTKKLTTTSKIKRRCIRAVGVLQKP